MDAYHILVIVLSITLAVLLVASIVLVVGLIKLTTQVRNITAKAESVMDDVEAVSEFFRKSAAPVAIGNLLSNIIGTITNRRKNK